MFRLIPLAFLCAAGCASNPLDQTQVAAINEALSNRTAIAKKCGIAEPDRSASFQSAASKRLDPAVRSRLAEASARIIADAQAEEAEYICTPEMFEQSQAAADQAQAEWAEISRAN